MNNHTSIQLGLSMIRKIMPILKAVLNVSLWLRGTLFYVVEYRVVQAEHSDFLLILGWKYSWIIFERNYSFWHFHFRMYWVSVTQCSRRLAKRIIFYDQVKTQIIIIVLYLLIFRLKIESVLCTLSVGFILKIFLNFRKFQPRYSKKIYS